MSGKASSARPLICLVDDENDITEIYSEVLRSFADTLSFSDPKEFLDYLRNPRNLTPDLIISDFKMPSSTGVEMVRRAIEMGRHFPVILLSGHLDKEAALSAVGIGIYRLMEKPVPEEVLLDAVEQILIENDIHLIQKELRRNITKLKELYHSMYEALMVHINPEVAKRLLVETYADGTVKGELNIDQEVEKLERQMDRLIQAERQLQSVRKSKSGAI